MAKLFFLYYCQVFAKYSRKACISTLLPLWFKLQIFLGFRRRVKRLLWNHCGIVAVEWLRGWVSSWGYSACRPMLPKSRKFAWNKPRLTRMHHTTFRSCCIAEPYITRQSIVLERLSWRLHVQPSFDDWIECPDHTSATSRLGRRDWCFESNNSKDDCTVKD